MKDTHEVDKTSITRPRPGHCDRIEARTNTRTKILRKGTIVYNHRMSTMECAVFDLSEGGGRLRPIEFGQLPDQFELRVLFGETYQCQVIHKSGDQIGVRFV